MPLFNRPKTPRPPAGDSLPDAPGAVPGWSRDDKTPLEVVRGRYEFARQFSDLARGKRNWQWVAADTDVNGVIDSADLRHCKQLLLGEMDSVVYPGLRFYPLDFVFPVGNPLALPIPNFIMVDPAAPSVPIEFAAVKTCDFNCSSFITDVEEIAFSSGNIGPAQPNPTTAGLSIPLMLAQPASVAVEIADLSGRVVYRSAASYGAGDQRLEVPAQAFPQTGLYIWRVQAGEAWQTGKVLKQ